MARLILMLTACALLAVGCGGSRSGTPSPTSLGGQAGVDLCNAENPAGLPVIVQQIEQVEDTVDTGSLVAALATTLTLVQQLQLDPDSEAARWQPAGEDAIQQLQRRMDDPERRAGVADHAARTLGILQDRLCP